MESLKAKLEAFQRSRVGLFVKKVMEDQAPNLAALLAWGTLSAILPLILGVLSVAGLLLRDPQRLDEVYNTLLLLVPAQAAGPLGDALQSVREASAAPAGIFAIVLLLINGSSFFSNMSSVFDQAYHVESRNFLMQRVVAGVMLVITTILVMIATLAAGLTSLIGSVPLGLPIGPGLVKFLGWSISIVCAFLLFILIYKVLPHAKQGWRDVLPGTLLSSVLLLVISQIFPLYVALFPPNHAYAVFGVFLVFTFWLYLLGFVLVLGAELNAFLQESAQPLAVEAVGAARAMGGGGAPDEECALRPSLAGRLLGFVGLLVAVLLLRARAPEPTD
jgi:membrane protein